MTNSIEMKHTGKNFISIDKNHQINTSIIDEISWFNIEKLNFEYFKSFLILLKDVMFYFKNNNIKIIKQYVREEDIIFFKKSSKTNIDNNVWIISTNIEDFLDEIINVFGICKI